MRPSPGLGKVRGRQLRRTGLATSLVAVALAACASAPPAPVAVPPDTPPDEIAGFASTTTSVFGAADVASEAVDTDVLSDLLDAAEFESGVRRTYAGAGLSIRRLEVRVLRFGSSAGADRYLAWLQSHVADLIGDVERSAELRVRDVPVFVHLPDACCPKEPAVALAAWRRGRDIVRVIVAGPAADGPRAAELIEEVRGSSFGSGGA
jgi:nicotinamidase-related amidase